MFKKTLIKKFLFTASSPVFKLTRSRVQTKAQEVAVEIINQTTEQLIVDRERLQVLLKSSVTLTEGYTVPRLEKLYSILAQCVFNHRLEYNKSALVEVCYYIAALII